jgi:hypothetical protein
MNLCYLVCYDLSLLDLRNSLVYLGDALCQFPLGSRLRERMALESPLGHGISNGRRGRACQERGKRRFRSCCSPRWWWRTWRRVVHGFVC